jgi:3-oxoadipate enol-lactonase
MDFIEVNGTALRYELRGSGSHTVILLHEMGGTLESWDLVVPQLAAGSRVLRYDTRGAGLSEKIRGSLSIDTLVADLMALLDALKIGDRVVLVGMAVGGAIALAGAARHPERVAAVVASSPATGIAAIYRMLVGLDLDSELARISCPVLLIAGALDATRPPAVVEAIAGSITNARYLLLPTGHYAAIQTPEILTTAVLEFMACSVT